MSEARSDSLHTEISAFAFSFARLARSLNSRSSAWAVSEAVIVVLQVSVKTSGASAPRNLAVVPRAFALLKRVLGSPRFEPRKLMTVLPIVKVTFTAIVFLSVQPGRRAEVVASELDHGDGIEKAWGPAAQHAAA